MAIQYFDKIGLAKLWNKARAAFADKTTTQTELDKKFELPSGGNTGQVLSKTDSGTAWVSPVANLSNIPSSYLYAQLLGNDYDISIQGASYKNFTISNTQIVFDDPGMYLLTLEFDKYSLEAMRVIVKSNKNYTFANINNKTYTFVIASTSDVQAKISYDFVGSSSATHRVSVSIIKIADDVFDYMVFNGTTSTTLQIISKYGINQKKNSDGNYTLTFQQTGTYKISAYSTSSPDNTFDAVFPQNASGYLIHDGDEVYFEVNNTSTDKLSLITDSYGDDTFANFVIIIEKV